MESLSEHTWDVVICGTGLPQSLLALALSRSDKKILHIDPNAYYGGSEAAFSLQEAEDWASSVGNGTSSIYSSASITKAEGYDSLRSRAYALSLAPHLIHTRATLLSQLVSSRAFRQIDFLAVGSFFIYKPASRTEGNDAKASLARIPSTREAVFLSTSIPAKAKRGLMKFLKFVLDYNAEGQVERWEPHAAKLLADFLLSEFKLDEELRTYVLTLTLSLDGKISTRDGLDMIHRHLTSMGVFGTGFAAVYPKWGGDGEIAQVACRAGAVGGTVYMLGTGAQKIKAVEGADDVEIELTNGVAVKSKLVVQGSGTPVAPTQQVSRLVAVVDSPLTSLFEIVTEGAPTPAVAVVAFPPGSVRLDDGTTSAFPVYAMVNTSETGECPVGQSVLYLTTPHSIASKSMVEQCLNMLLSAVDDVQRAKVLYQLYYEQAGGPAEPSLDGRLFTFPSPSLSLSFDDAVLDPVHQAWRQVIGDADEGVDEYMVFKDREGMGDDEAEFDD